ncbi:unnamed protein product [Phytophthora fragariaefolia]|uniref:Unnamed protein product n=1 Tax=Phytophthora fragariaefolia TaxID=1490495 RepID=A0A9W6X4C1_9STRA|nr:unnamed protein product [Phytophthora fragariaefolia]
MVDEFISRENDDSFLSKSGVLAQRVNEKRHDSTSGISTDKVPKHKRILEAYGHIRCLSTTAWKCWISVAARRFAT